MIRSRLYSVLLFNTGVALAVAACGGGTADNGGTGGGTSAGTGGAGGSTGGSSPMGTGGSTGGTMVAAGGSTGGTGMTTGGAGGTTGGTGMTTGGAGGTTGGTTGGTGMTTGGAGGTTGGTGMTTGGSAGMGMGTGGSTSGSAGMGMGAGGTGSSGSCTITATATQSDQIGTVFNVAFTTDMPNVDSAHIDFGPDTNYGLTAPVDLKDQKTPLLGMKPSKMYHYRVVVGSGTNMCTGTDQTVTTGPVMNGLPKPMITTNDATALAGGFLLTEQYAGKQVVFILDKDNDIVWWFDPKSVTSSFSDLTRARMSTDGKTMWIAHGNVPSGTGRMMKVGMDGSGAQDVSSSFTGMNHDFTIVNDAMGDWIYFIAYGSGGSQCDDIKEYSPSGMTKTIMNIGSAFTSGACHANAIEYSKDDDALIVSELDHDAYVKIKRTGEKVWVLGGGSNNNFTGDGATWDNEHNLHVLGADHIIMFNNGSGSAGSNAIELQLDTTAKTATKLWTYTASPAINNAIMGDVQRLDNGNTLVTYSTQGVIHEVSADKKLLQSLTWGTSGALGYAVKRKTLYGPSPK